MKILDKYLIKRFLVPFFATFLVVLFVLIILTLWVQLDRMAGKGLSPTIIFKYLGYTMLIVVPEALPIGILLSSIMALGNMSEKYEYAAIKSAGISLYRLLKPLTIFMVVLSGLNFLYLNYVFPYAQYESINMMRNIKLKQPAMALVSGSFNNDIPDFSIKFSEKYGEKKNLLKDVLIYDLRDKKFNNVSITAKYGEIKSNENSKYMTLVLKDGFYYKEIIPKRYKTLSKDNMPFIKSHFEEHIINFDIGGLDDMGKNNRSNELKQMLSLKQIKEKITKDKIPYHKYVDNTLKKFYVDIKAKKLFKDTILSNDNSFDIINEFNENGKIKIFKKAVSSIGHNLTSLKLSKNTLKRYKLKFFQYNVEYYKRIAISLACLLLFLIGAPLGSIIRKGGFGVPMISAIIIYVTYHFIGVFTRGMADTGEMPAILGAWLPTLIMLPLSISLIVRAVQDKGLFNIDAVIEPISKGFKKIFGKLYKKTVEV